MSDRSGVLVGELCGLPGAGKTYVATRLRDHCLRLGVQLRLADATISAARPLTRRAARKSLLVSAQMLSHPVSSARFAVRVEASRQPRQREVLSWCVQWLATQRLLAGARREGGAHLFDEGPLQVLWSIGLRGDVTGFLRPQTERLLAPDVPDLLVVVEAPLETVARRLAARRSRHSRTQQLSGPQLRAELSRGSDLLDRLVAWRQSSRGNRVEVAYVRNLDHESPDEQIRRAAELLAGSPARARPAPVAPVDDDGRPAGS